MSLNSPVKHMEYFEVFKEFPRLRPKCCLLALIMKELALVTYGGTFDEIVRQIPA